MGSPISSDLSARESIVMVGGMGISLDGAEQENVPERAAGLGQDGPFPGQSIAAQHNAPNTTPADAGKAGANIVRFMTPAQCRVLAQGMKSEELAEHVAKNGWGDVLVKLGQLKPYVEVLWDRFGGLKGKDTIAGCRTKREFCEKRLNRSIRAVQFMLYGRTPKKAERTGCDQRAEKGTVGKKAQAPLPPTVGPLLPDPAPGTMDELSQRINQMADTHEIGGVLGAFFGGLAQSLLEQHPYAPSSRITIQVFRKNQGRIAQGDWVKHNGGDARLTKLTGQEKALGRVVGKDKLHRPRIRWHDGQAWTKPYNLVRDDSVLVLFDFQVAEQFAEAYGSYPADGEAAPEEPLHNGTASDHFVDPGSLNSGVGEGGGIPSETSPPDRSEQANETAPAAQPPRTVGLLTVDGVTVEPGYTCKYNGINCRITQVWGGEDGGVSLVRMDDERMVGVDPVPVRDLRFIADPGDRAL